MILLNIPQANIASQLNCVGQSLYKFVFPSSCKLVAKTFLFWFKNWVKNSFCSSFKSEFSKSNLISDFSL
jgi:hypothetical protein